MCGLMIGLAFQILKEAEMPGTTKIHYLLLDLTKHQRRSDSNTRKLELPNAARRLMYITNLDPASIHALAATSS